MTGRDRNHVGEPMRRRIVVAALTASLGVTLGIGALGAQRVMQYATLEAPRPTPVIYDRNGRFLTEIAVETSASRDGGRQLDHGYWPIEHLPDRVVRATLALEERRFFYHPGVDLLAVMRAVWQNLTRSRHRVGASTVAMQIARMQHPAPRNVWSKAREAAVAVALTLRHGREKLLAHYLQLIPYGNGSHGIAHAARWYFDKPADDLSWAEIALLSAIPQSPTLMNPLRPDGLARAKGRGHRMLDELARQKVIDAAELALAHQQLAGLPQPVPPRRPDAFHAIMRYEAMAREGRLDPPDLADPRIRATIDLDVQRQVMALARRYVAAWNASGAEQAAVMVVERESSAVLADVGSIDYYDSPAGAIDFSRTQRSPGSTLKPFIYAFAIDRGLLRPTDVMADLPDGAAGISNVDGHFLGPLLPRQALANSRNVPATNLLRKIGLDPMFHFLRDLGVHDLESPADGFGLSMAIGSLPTTLDRLLRAYGALANDGQLGELIWYDGQNRRDPVRALSADAARLVTSFLSDPLARLPSFPRFGSTEYPFAVALKTGTSQGFRDAWTLAWSRNYLVGVWVGRGDAGTMAQLTGAGSAAHLAHAVMLQLHGTHPGDLEDTEFPPPASRVAVVLCTVGGKRSTGNCGETLTEWTRPDEMPEADEAAVAWSPRDGSRIALTLPAEHRAWAKEKGFPIAENLPPHGAIRLTIAAPADNSHFWRNPETPPALDRLPLKAVVEPHVPQIVWYVDDEPFAISDPDMAVLWPIRPGAHRFQLRLPLQDTASATARVVVE
jgi:penicillin-binding protein 1C